MKFNDNCRLFLRNVYSYDIPSCHYSILEKIGIDISDIDKNIKETRNIRIGQMMKGNSRLSKMLNKVTNSIISEYLHINNVKNEELLLRQYDGVILTKRLEKTATQSLPLNLQTIFEVFIISFDRNKYIAYDGEKITVKGVSYRYEEMDKIYKKMLKINFSIKEIIFKSLQKIKDEIIFGENPKLFCIPTLNNKFVVFFKRYREIEISKPTIKLIDLSDVDRERYFNFYLLPFTKSIVSEFM